MIKAFFYLIGDDRELQTNNEFVTYIQRESGPLERKNRDHHIIEDVIQTTHLFLPWVQIAKSFCS